MKKLLIVVLLGIVSVVLLGVTPEEKEDLIFMYKEEKLAYDVYDRFDDLYTIRVFGNIKKAENTHMELVKGLLIEYGIDVPKVEAGNYNDEELDQLYKELVAQGERSLKDALEVGVKVEEKDIADLKEAMKGASDDIRAIYSNLLQGSEKHLRAFNKF